MHHLMKGVCIVLTTDDISGARSWSARQHRNKTKELRNGFSTANVHWGWREETLGSVSHSFAPETSQRMQSKGKSQSSMNEAHIGQIRNLRCAAFVECAIELSYWYAMEQHDEIVCLTPPLGAPSLEAAEGGKKGKTVKKARKFLATKKARKSKKTRKGKSGKPLFCRPLLQIPDSPFSKPFPLVEHANLRCDKPPSSKGYGLT